MTRTLCLLVLLVGCAHAAKQTPVQAKAEAAAPAEEKPPELSTALNGLPTPVAPPTVITPAAGNNLGVSPYMGTIDRAGLIAIVDQGLGRFFSHLHLSPVVTQGKFVGFSIARIDPAWGEVGIAVGDVLLRVNGQPIERPEQAMAAFESLRVASEVALELTRAGVPATLRYRIE
jgi:hypothetical protein